MSDIGDILNELAQDILPEVFAAAMPDTCSVVQDVLTQDSGGGVVRSSTTNAYTGIPCSYERVQKFAWRKTEGDAINATQMYTVSMPMFHNGSRINLDPEKHTIVVDARMEGATVVIPSITFRIVGIGIEAAGAYELVAAKEN